jgi:hypothetical protein
MLPWAEGVFAPRLGFLALMAVPETSDPGRENRARITGEWLQTEARFLA